MPEYPPKVEFEQAKELLNNWLIVMGLNNPSGVTTAAKLLNKSRRSLERVLGGQGSLSLETRFAMSAIYAKLVPWGDILQFEDSTMRFVVFDNVQFSDVRIEDEVRVAVPSGWFNEKRYLDGRVGHIQEPYVLIDVYRTFEPGVIASSEPSPNFEGRKFAIRAEHIYIARRADGTQYVFPKGEN